ncbi:MAG: STAS-like domain-containing protein [Candidatus Sungbacteria bacterium]|nr:STAS-like domain-containing protein [Candidatus Sungbacteria bacterium]
MVTIELFPLVGGFAENKDIARDIRRDQILPALKNGESVVLDFSGIESTTQSFVHSLISDVMREYGSDVMDKLVFKNCSETIQKIISIVVDYMQQT